MRFYFTFLLLILSLACSEKPASSNMNSNVNKSKTNPAQSSSKIPVYTYEIVNTFKHDSKAFTEGLFFHNGFLYESTGQEGRSDLRKVELDSGKIVQQI